MSENSMLASSDEFVELMSQYISIHSIHPPTEKDLRQFLKDLDERKEVVSCLQANIITEMEVINLVAAHLGTRFILPGASTGNLEGPSTEIISKLLPILTKFKNNRVE